mmetsp:Transcript_15366/g.35616  ORF Transcript_15366/g.35616 Transcript_15366/m.35616 type:complete len:228 (-) Transcript_15366:2645-3328(-)
MSSERATEPNPSTSRWLKTAVHSSAVTPSCHWALVLTRSCAVKWSLIPLKISSALRPLVIRLRSTNWRMRSSAVLTMRVGWTHPRKAFQCTWPSCTGENRFSSVLTSRALSASGPGSASVANGWRQRTTTRRVPTMASEEEMRLRRAWISSPSHSGASGTRAVPMCGSPSSSSMSSNTVSSRHGPSPPSRIPSVRRPSIAGLVGKGKRSLCSYTGSKVSLMAGVKVS